MFDSLLNPPSIGTYSSSLHKEKNVYSRAYTGNGCTICDIISYLEDAATLFEQIANQYPFNQQIVEVCNVIRGNLLFIARDHLTDNPDMPR